MNVKLNEASKQAKRNRKHMCSKLEAITTLWWLRAVVEKRDEIENPQTNVHIANTCLSLRFAKYSSYRKGLI
jgi:hypothetical protein